MKTEAYKLGTSKLLIEILEKRLILFKERLIEEFMRGNISINEIINRRYLKLFYRVEIESFFQESNHVGLNYGELNYLIKLGDKKAYDTLKKRFNLISRDKIYAIINECVKRNVIFPEFQNLPEVKQLLNRINNRQIGPVEFKEFMDQIPLSKLTDLVQELYKPDYLYDLISIEAIRNLESQYKLD